MYVEDTRRGWFVPWMAARVWLMAWTVSQVVWSTMGVT